MPEEKPPWLFIYFRHRIKIIQPVKSAPDGTFIPRDELWITGIGPDAMIRYAVPKIHVNMWDRHFIALLPGCRWSAIILSTPAALAFRPPNAPRESELLVPEHLIHRIYDMANRRLIHTRNM